MPPVGGVRFLIAAFNATTWSGYRILAERCWRIWPTPALNLGLLRLDGGPGLDWRAKVDLFEQLRRGHDFGSDFAAKFGVHRPSSAAAHEPAVLEGCLETPA